MDDEAKRITNLIEKLFSSGIALFIFLIPPLIWFFAGISVCSRQLGGCEMEPLAYFIFLPPFYLIEWIIFLLCRFLINKFSPRKFKEYNIAFLLTGIILITLFFLSSELPMATAYLTQNANLCRLIRDYERNRCIIQIIKENKNELLCELASNEYNYKEYCYIDAAEETGNPNICEKAGSEKDFCYLRMAEELKDPNLCKKIEDLFGGNRCREKFQNKLSKETNAAAEPFLLKLR